MADGKGFRIVVKINLPPEEQYHSGHSVIFQGDTAEEITQVIARTIDPVPGTAYPEKNAIDQARFILLRFIEFAQQGAVGAALDPGTAAATAPASGAAGAATKKKGAAAPAAKADTASAPQSDLASAAVLKAVAKKTGKSVEELGELTKAQAQELLKGGGK